MGITPLENAFSRLIKISLIQWLKNCGGTLEHLAKVSDLNDYSVIEACVTDFAESLRLD